MPRKKSNGGDPPKAKGKGKPRSANNSDVELGKRLRLRRLEVEFSQDDLAKALGVSFQQVQKYEKGVNRIGASRLVEIAAALNTEVGYFYGAVGRDREVEAELYPDAKFSLRLLRAYNAIDDAKVQRQFVSLMETVAGLQGEE